MLLMKNFPKEQLPELIMDNKNRIFSIKFIKKDGSKRTMNCRVGVKKYLHGGCSTTKHISKYVDVYDLKAKGYRKINLDTTYEVLANNTKYLVI